MNSLKLENQLCFPIYALSRQITALYRPHLERLNLTYPQYLVMLILWEQEEVFVREIGSLLWLDSGTLTPLLKRMEENGLLGRSRCAEDERIVLVHISEKGKKLKEQAKYLPKIIQEELESEGEQLSNFKEQLCVLSAKCKNKLQV